MSEICCRIEQLVHLPGLKREASSLAPKLMAVLQPALATTGIPQVIPLLPVLCSVAKAIL